MKGGRRKMKGEDVKIRCKKKMQREDERRKEEDERRTCKEKI